MFLHRRLPCAYLRISVDPAILEYERHWYIFYKQVEAKINISDCIFNNRIVYFKIRFINVFARHTRSFAKDGFGFMSLFELEQYLVQPAQSMYTYTYIHTLQNEPWIYHFICAITNRKIYIEYAYQKNKLMLEIMQQLIN